MMETNNEAKYPMRINKYLATRHISTRREADEIIASGRVKINGRKAVLGDKVAESDIVTVQKDIRKNKSYVYLAYNKPRGVVTHSPQKGERGIADVFKFSQNVFPLGRLDKDSWGLIILTNDGRITDPLLSPDRYHEKEYKVKVDKKITPGFMKNLENGVKLDDGYVTRKCQAKKLDDFTFSIILTEGKKRQIRRMCEQLGRVVTDLKRERVMNIKLGNIKTGVHRKIEGQELAEFLGLLGLGDAGAIRLATHE